MKIKKSKTKIIVLSVFSVLAIIGFLAYRVDFITEQMILIRKEYLK